MHYHIFSVTMVFYLFYYILLAAPSTITIILKTRSNRMSPFKRCQLDTQKRGRLWWVRTSADLQRARLSVPEPRRWTCWGEDVRERGVRVQTLQADRAALRLPGALSGRGGSAESRLGHRGAFLPVPVGVLRPVRSAEPAGGGSVELLLHPHIWSVSAPFGLVHISLLLFCSWLGDVVICGRKGWAVCDDAEKCARLLSKVIIEKLCFLVCFIGKTQISPLLLYEMGRALSCVSSEVWTCFKLACYH